MLISHHIIAVWLGVEWLENVSLCFISAVETRKATKYLNGTL